MWLESSPQLKKVQVNAVSSGYSGFLPQGKLTGWDSLYGPTLIASRRCGDPVLVGKLNKQITFIIYFSGRPVQCKAVHEQCHLL